MPFFKKLPFRCKSTIGFVGLLTLATMVGYWVAHHLYQSHLPTPMGSSKSQLPIQYYQPLEGDFPYQFEHSIHAHVDECTSTYKRDYWINLYYPVFDATIYLSYQSDNHATLRKLCEGAASLAFKHQVKASVIEESIIQTPKGYQVHVIELFGPVPTPFQFYTTDGQKHFLRGALYFNTTTQHDALTPVIAYIKKDIIHMLHTLTWKP